MVRPADSHSDALALALALAEGPAPTGSCNEAGTATRCGTAGGSRSRRVVLSAAAVLGAASGLTLVACGSSGGSSDASASAGTSAPAGAGSSAPAGAGSSSAAGASGTVLGPTSEVPVGGGMIFTSQKVVVTQPTAGTFKAFSSTCTHRGCQVNKVQNGQIQCPCHGSKYSVADGSVVGGPAPAPLPAANVSVSGTNLVLGT